MGASSSALKDLPPDKQFQLFKKLKKNYPDDAAVNKTLTDYENYLLWKGRLELLVTGESPTPTLDDLKSDYTRCVYNTNTLNIGDVVRAKDVDGQLTPEGLIMEIFGGSIAQIDFGDAIVQYPLESCTLVLSGLDFEVNDHVQVKPEGMSLYFTGVVIALHDDSQTMDIQMAGDDPDDIEYNVPRDRVVKLNSGRPIALGHWRALKNVVHVSNVFRAFH